MERMALQAVKTISEAKDDADFHIYVHPGVEECVLRESKKLVASVEQFAQTTRSQFPDTQVTVLSVPQVIDDHCEAANSTFQNMAEANHIHFLSLTKIQSDLCFNRMRTYDERISKRVARVVAANIADQLGLKLVTPPTKKDAGGRSSDEQVVKTSKTQKPSNTPALPDGGRQTRPTQSSNHSRQNAYSRRSGISNAPQRPNQQAAFYVPQLPPQDNRQYHSVDNPQWASSRGQQKRGGSPYFPQGKRRQIFQ